MTRKWISFRKIQRDVDKNRNRPRNSFNSNSADSSCRSRRSNTKLSDEPGFSTDVRAANIDENSNHQIDVQQLRLFVGTWNVAGIKPPSDESALVEWLGIDDQDQTADIYVIGFQEIVPLNAGNILRNEDKGESARKWDTLIMSALNGGPSSEICYNNSHSYNKPATSSSILGSIHNCKQVQDCSRCPAAIPFPDINSNYSRVDNCDEDYFAASVQNCNNGSTFPNNRHMYRKMSLTAPPSPVMKSRQYLYSYNDDDLPDDAQIVDDDNNCNRRHSSADHSDVIAGRLISDDSAAIANKGHQDPTIHCTISSTASTSTVASSPCLNQRRHEMRCGYGDRIKQLRPRRPSSETLAQTQNQCRNPNPSRSAVMHQGSDNYGSRGSSISSARRSNYIKVVSKQMVGLFVSVWIKRELCSRVKAVEVSRVGCGIMGVLGNKGAVSVSLSLDETNICFVCSHLNSGGRDTDTMRRNADVREILRRTRFRRRGCRHQLSGKRKNDGGGGMKTNPLATSSRPCSSLPRTILAHDRIIWFGDLNYRLSLPPEELNWLMAKQDWKSLLEKDQLKHEKGINGVFEGWQEGHIYFNPTYKYVPNTNVYYMHHVPMSDEGTVVKRRAPAWCDRILWNGKGLKQISYRRSESKHSDHRPVASLFMVDVEVLSNLSKFAALKLDQYPNVKSCENLNSTPCITKVNVEEIFSPKLTQPPMMATRGDKHLIIFNMVP